MSENSSKDTETSTENSVDLSKCLKDGDFMPLLIALSQGNSYLNF